MKIDITKQLHQDNLKAEIWFQFKTRFYNSGMALRCEYAVTGSRFDIVAYNMSTLDVFAIIEVRRIGAKKPPKVNGRKHGRYSSFGPKIFYISDFNRIDELMNDLDCEFYLNKQGLQVCTLTN